MAKHDATDPVVHAFRHWLKESPKRFCRFGLKIGDGLVCRAELDLDAAVQRASSFRAVVGNGFVGSVPEGAHAIRWERLARVRAKPCGHGVGARARECEV